MLFVSHIGNQLVMSRILMRDYYTERTRLLSGTEQTEPFAARPVDANCVGGMAAPLLLRGGTRDEPIGPGST